MARIAYGFFGQTVILLLLYAAAALLTAAKFLPNDPLAVSLPYPHISGAAHVLLHGAILSGLLGGGLLVARQVSAADARWARLAFRAWTVFLVLKGIAALLGWLEGRAGLELPPVLFIVQTTLAAFVLVIVVRRGLASPIALVWSIGLGVVIVAALVGLLPTTDLTQERIMRATAVGLRDNVGYMLAALALGSWLIRRFSAVTARWGDDSLYVLAGLLALAGTGLTIGGLYPFVRIEAHYVIGVVSAIAVPVIVLIAAAHSYRALALRSPNATLAPHWFALAVLLLIVAGISGGLQSLPVARQWTTGTRLTDAQTWLVLFVPVATLLGAINQCAADLHGRDGRITGYIPFWLVGFGVIGGALAQAAGGVAQVYLERVVALPLNEAERLIAPLDALRIVAVLMVAAGLAVYALGFWYRRPPDSVQ